MERINAKKETASKVNTIFESNWSNVRYIQDPKVYVETIIEVYEKFSTFVVQGFSNHHGFIVALDKVRISVWLLWCFHSEFFRHLVK
jgi:hypothetical protein